MKQAHGSQRCLCPICTGKENPNYQPRIKVKHWLFIHHLISANWRDPPLKWRLQCVLFDYIFIANKCFVQTHRPALWILDPKVSEDTKYILLDYTEMCIKCTKYLLFDVMLQSRRNSILGLNTLLNIRGMLLQWRYRICMGDGCTIWGKKKNLLFSLWSSFGGNSEFTGLTWADTDAVFWSDSIFKYAEIQSQSVPLPKFCFRGFSCHTFILLGWKRSNSMVYSISTEYQLHSTNVSINIINIGRTRSTLVGP